MSSVTSNRDPYAASLEQQFCPSFPVVRQDCRAFTQSERQDGTARDALP